MAAAAAVGTLLDGAITSAGFSTSPVLGTPLVIALALVHVSQAQGRIPVTVFHLQDRVNLGNYTELEQAAREEYDRGMRDLVIDLSRTPSLTSIGIRALVAVHRILSADRRNHLKLAGLLPASREMLEIAGITPQD